MPDDGGSEAGPRRLLLLDRVRGLAIVAVICLHAEIEAGVALPGVHAVNDALGPVRLPVLVAVSGVLLRRAVTRPVGEYVALRVRHLLWPYVVWSLLDGAQTAAVLHRRGETLDWSAWLVRLVLDPPTYLWFLLYLFCFACLARGLGPRTRAVLGPAVLVTATVAPLTAPAPHQERFVWLFGWFLIGDLAGRLTRRWQRARPAPAWDVLGAVGRSSVVFYSSHLVVAILVTDLVAAAGVEDPGALFAAAVLLPLTVGVVLVRARRFRAVDALFVLPWPDGRTARPQPPRPAGRPPGAQSGVCPTDGAVCLAHAAT